MLNSQPTNSLNVGKTPPKWMLIAQAPAKPIFEEVHHFMRWLRYPAKPRETLVVQNLPNQPFQSILVWTPKEMMLFTAFLRQNNAALQGKFIDINHYKITWPYSKWFALFDPRKPWGHQRCGVFFLFLSPHSIVCANSMSHTKTWEKRRDSIPEKSFNWPKCKL